MSGRYTNESGQSLISSSINPVRSREVDHGSGPAGSADPPRVQSIRKRCLSMLISISLDALNNKLPRPDTRVDAERARSHVCGQLPMMSSECLQYTLIHILVRQEKIFSLRNALFSYIYQA